MRLRAMAIVAGAAALLMMLPAAAEESGLVGLHSKVKVGGKLCFSDHFHHGSSSGHATRKAAEVAAIRSWQDFTAWEYGGSWGSYANAVAKNMSCSGGGSWSCNVEARPCRRR